MEIIAILVAGLVGWKNGTFGMREVKGIALVVAGWTAVTTAASVPYLTLDAFLFAVFYHTVLVAVPYSVGALMQRLSRTRR